MPDIAIQPHTWPTFNILFSYYYLRQRPIILQTILALSEVPGVKVMIDSGAFTLFQLKSKGRGLGRFGDISVEEYTQACKQHFHGRVWNYVALDMIQNPAVSARNLQFMLDAGLRPMPVMVYGQDVDVVPEYVKINRHICVAGGADAKLKWMLRRFSDVYRASSGQALIHGLAFIKHPYIYQFPLHSVDASTWAKGSKFGEVTFWEPQAGLTICGWRDLASDPAWAARVAREYGVSAALLKDCASYKLPFSIPSVTTIYAHFARMAYSHLAHGLQIFLVQTGLDWLAYWVAVLESSSYGRLDYMEARERVRRARSMPRDERMLDEVISALKRLIVPRPAGSRRGAIA